MTSGSVCRSLGLSSENQDRVDRFSPAPHFEVKVGRSHVTCGAALAYDFSCTYPLSYSDIDGRQVRIDRLQSLAMIDPDDFSEPSHCSSKLDSALCHSVYGRSLTYSEIYASVHVGL